MLFKTTISFRLHSPMDNTIRNKNWWKMKYYDRDLDATRRAYHLEQVFWIVL